ncbi:MAG: hydroxyacid dehydrogenase, partial [Candidatus Omnitrophica bacterium]|nr:hydroxyacid dehydrogenase [Candidatus Omnitrophota bacterium]
MKNKVLISTSTFAKADRLPLERMEEVGLDVILNPFKRRLTKDELLGLLPGVTGLIAGLETLDYEVMSQSQLKVISRCGAGMSNVDLEAAQKLGIAVRNTPDAPTNSVAELTLGSLLGLLRMIPQMDKDMHDGKWNKQTGYELKGKKIGIVGFGRIGRRLAELLEPFGVEIIFIDPFVKSDDGSWQVLDLEDALPLVDVMTLHCSGEEIILGENEFSKMKDGVFILNAARGANISEEALINALDSGKVAGAWIDTFCDEPYNGRLKE